MSSKQEQDLIETNAPNMYKEEEIDLTKLLKFIWAKKNTLIKWGLISMVLGVVIAFSIPRKYQTSVQLTTESGNMSKANMGGLGSLLGANLNTRTAGVTETMYPEIIKTRPVMAKLADMKVSFEGDSITFYNYIVEKQKRPWWRSLMSLPRKLFAKDERKPEPDHIDLFDLTSNQQKYFETFKQCITVSIDKKTNIYTVLVEMQDNIIAATIADALVKQLETYMTDYHTAKSKEDYLMKKKIFEEAQHRFYTTDTEYAAAVDKNQGLSTRSAQLKIDRLMNERTLAYSIYKELATQVENSKIKLQEDTPIITIIEPASISHKPVSPNKKNIIILSMLLGVVLATAKVILFKNSK